MLPRRRSRVFFALLPSILLAVAAAAWGFPGRLGISGLDRVLSASLPKRSTYRTAISATYEYAQVSDSVRLIKEDYNVDTVLAVDDAEHYIDARFLFGLGLGDHLEAATVVRASGRGFQYDQVPPRDQFVGYLDGSWAMADVSLAAKYARPVLPWLEAGASAGRDHDLRQRILRLRQRHPSAVVLRRAGRRGGAAAGQRRGQDGDRGPHRLGRIRLV